MLKSDLFLHWNYRSGYYEVFVYKL